MTLQYQKKFPISEKSQLRAKNPYGLTKIINEQIAEVYSNIIKKNLFNQLRKKS